MNQVMNQGINRGRCCSFCRNPGHTINLCQDPRIEITWKECLKQVDLRLGNSMEEEDFNHADMFLRQLPLPFLRALGVQAGGISVRSTPELHISAIKTAIREEAEYFIYLRWNERIDYLNWLDPDSYDFEEEEEAYEAQGQGQNPIDESQSHIIDLNAAFIEEDPTDISHFAFFDRTPMILEELEQNGFQNIWDDEEGGEEPRTIIEPLMLCLETATELSAITECVVCLDEKSAIHFDTTNCGHSFCHLCICHHLDTSKNGPTCPNCRTIIRTLEVKDVENYHDIVKRYGKKAHLVTERMQVEEETVFDWLAPSGITIFM